MRELELGEVARTEQRDVTQRPVTRNHIGRNAVATSDFEPVATQRFEEHTPGFIQVRGRVDLA